VGVDNSHLSFRQADGMDGELDCPGFGPGPRGPGSGPDRTLRSECPGQGMVGPDLCQGVQVRMLSEPDLRVGPGPDPNRTYFLW
jgi:hypothetical protein